MSFAIASPRLCLALTSLLCGSIFLSGCGRGINTSQIQDFTIGGKVSGLMPGAQLTVSNNGGSPLTLASNGSFQFPEPLSGTSSYHIIVVNQPTGETCTIANYTGSGMTANVSNVAVNCSVNTFSVGGAVSGLIAGSHLVLVDNGSDTLSVSASGAFNFASPIPYQGSYSVSVGTQPAGQTCTVSHGAGSSIVAAVSTVSVLCAADTFTIGGSATGLGSGDQVTLDNNGTDPLTLIANGPFTFSAPVAYNSGYNVTVGTQPTGKTCSVANGAGLASAANVVNVALACAPETFPLRGSLAGLLPGTQLVLENNGGDALTLTGNGSFAFPTPVPYGGSFDVTVGTEPLTQTCTVSGATGGPLQGSPATVNVLCALDTYSVGGTVTGLTANGLVLKDNGGDPLGVNSGSAIFQFPQQLASGSGYDVTVFQQPVGEVCTVTNAASTIGSANVTAVAVVCLPSLPTISCTASPASVPSGGLSVITSVGYSPAGRPLTYSYSATSGSISGSGTIASLDTTGAAPGVIQVTCNVVDDRGQTASATTNVTVTP